MLRRTEKIDNEHESGRPVTRHDIGKCDREFDTRSMLTARILKNAEATPPHIVPIFEERHDEKRGQHKLAIERQAHHSDR